MQWEGERPLPCLEGQGPACGWGIERVGIRTQALGSTLPAKLSRLIVCLELGRRTWGGTSDLQCPGRMGRGLGPGLRLWRAGQASVIATTQHLSLRELVLKPRWAASLKDASSQIYQKVSTQVQGWLPTLCKMEESKEVVGK